MSAQWPVVLKHCVFAVFVGRASRPERPSLSEAPEPRIRNIEWTSVILCISMHRAKQNRVERRRVQ